MTRARRASYAGLSDTGRVRTHNEDTVLLSPPVFAVADGLGGHHAGEIASLVAIETLAEQAPPRPDAKALGRAVRAANRAVLQAAAAGQGHSSMGTTLTAAMVDGTSIVVAHVGDSRAYLFHANRLEQITNDHSMIADMLRQGSITVEESRVHPNRSIITRALGSDPNMRADIYEVDAEPGDRLLLCTDGLTGMLSDAKIADALSAYGDADSAARALIDAANAAGGHDNISVVVVDINDGNTAPGAASEARIRGIASILITLFVIAAIAGIAAIGVWRYAYQQAYVVSEDNRVVLYRGFPDTWAGLELRWLVQETTMTPGALGPVMAARLAQGIPVENVEAGVELLEQYQREIAEDAQ